MANDSPAAERSQSMQSIADGRDARTRLPAKLEASIEGLSGYKMDNVRVHYNSPEPARLGAKAYTKGTQIHVGPGQTQHLPHEAWHVVQQKQGRVEPNRQLERPGERALPINDDPKLEREADRMGAVALQRSASLGVDKASGQRAGARSGARPGPSGAAVQGVGFKEWAGRAVSPIPGRDATEKAWGVASRVAGVARGAGSMVGGLGRKVGLNLPGTYRSTTTTALSPELQAGLAAAKANQNPGAPPIPGWLAAGQRRPVVGVAYVPGAGAPAFNNGHRNTYRHRWARTFFNRDGLLPGVKGAGGYNEYYAQPTPGWTPAAGEAPWGSNRILRQTNDPTGTYWWATNDHYTSFRYIKDA